MDSGTSKFITAAIAIYLSLKTATLFYTTGCEESECTIRRKERGDGEGRMASSRFREEGTITA